MNIVFKEVLLKLIETRTTPINTKRIRMPVITFILLCKKITAIKMLTTPYAAAIVPFIDALPLFIDSYNIIKGRIPNAPNNIIIIKDVVVIVLFMGIKGIMRVAKIELIINVHTPTEYPFIFLPTKPPNISAVPQETKAIIARIIAYK